MFKKLVRLTIFHISPSLCIFVLVCVCVCVCVCARVYACTCALMQTNTLPVKIDTEND